MAYWQTGAPPIRLLLLARHTTGWWETLNQRTNRLASELADSPLVLHDGSLDPTERIDHHARALRAFATSVPDPATPGGQAPPVLADPVFANPLLVHMHALLSVCGAQVPHHRHRGPRANSRRCLGPRTRALGRDVPYGLPHRG